MSTITHISILLVDDHAVVREGYRRLLECSTEIRVTGEAANMAEAYQRFCELTPDVVVMDLALPGASGIEAMRRILARSPDTRVLVFSMHEDPLFLRRAIGAGALGYVTKASAPEVLVDAVREVAQGRQYLSPDIAHTMALRQVFHESPKTRPLSAREFEIMWLLEQGYTLNRIAERLGVSEKTVANYQSALRQKFGAGNGVQLAQIARRLGIHFSAVFADPVDDRYGGEVPTGPAGSN